MHLRACSFMGLIVFLVLGLMGPVEAQVVPSGQKKPAQKNKPGLKPGEVNTPAAKGERVMAKVKPGDTAPDFLLLTVAGDREIRLSRFQGKKPVVLIFGSYT